MDMLQTRKQLHFNSKISVNTSEERSVGEVQLKGSCRRQTQCHISAQLPSKFSKQHSL